MSAAVAAVVERAHGLMIRPRNRMMDISTYSLRAMYAHCCI